MTKNQPEYDVVIVGSGAAGGMSAYALSCAGVRVLMLEAGRDYDPVTETPMFEMPEDAPLRGSSTPDKPFGYFDATVDGGWQVPGEPYSSAEDTDFYGGDLECWAGAPIIGAAFRCVWASMTLSLIPETAWAQTGL